MKPIRPAIVRRRVKTHLELKEARDKLQQLASIDPLTQIPNRRRFDACLETEWQRAWRNQRWISLAILDVDFFKRYNDSYGHARGDECLRAVAQALVDVTRRPGDLVARYGGEEFALVLPETDADSMQQLMTALLACVHELAIEHRASECSRVVTVSVGAISLIPHVAEAHEAIETADKLLYRAKESGRDQCMLLDVMTGNTERIAIGTMVGDGGLA
jgi:diguanylate cyclase (GGDEF)-like protein